MLDPAPGRDAFGVVLLEELGARVDGHWRVRCRDGEAVLRRWGYDAAQVRWETELADRLAALGWPTPTLVADPVEVDGVWWTLHRMLPGAHRDERGPVEQRELGRTMARLHLDLRRLDDIPQRDGWRTVAQIADDPSLDALLAAGESRWPRDVRLLRLHLDRARQRVDEIGWPTLASPIIHGDGAPGNLLWDGRELSGLLDLELAHRDLRIAEFALAWRGKYDEVVRGYDEVAPLGPRERALLGPVFWIWVVSGAVEDLRRGRWEHEDGWTLRMLDRRSPLMGPDADWIVSAAG